MPEKSASLQKLVAAIARRENVAIGFLPGSSPAWLIGQIQRKINRPVLVVAEDQARAGQMIQELSLFCASAPLAFPALDYYQLEGTELSGARVAALARLLRAEAGLAVTSALSLFEPTISRELLKGYLFELIPGLRQEREEFLRRLLEAGYQAADGVCEPGEISVRGGIVDVFPPGAELPARIEFFGDQIESLRLFDPANQRSREKIDRYPVWPAREMILSPERGQELRPALYKLAEEIKKQPAGEQPVSFARALHEITGHLENRRHFFAEERFLPLVSANASLLDYLDQEWLVVVIDGLAVNQTLLKVSRKAEEDWARLAAAGSLLPPPWKVFRSSSEVSKKIAEFQNAMIGLSLAGTGREPPQEFSLGLEMPQPQELTLAIEPNPDLLFSPKLREPLSRLLDELKHRLAEKSSIVLVSATPSQRERLAELLREHEIFPAELESRAEYFEPVWPLATAVGDLCSGFKVPELGLVVISEREVFGEKIRRAPARAEFGEWREEDLSDLEPGELVVHIEHGIGISRGMIQLKVTSFEKWNYLKDRSRPTSSQPVLEIEYEGDAKLYLPVDRINLIQKYRNPGESHPRLDRLGTRSFELAKKSAEESIEILAQDLLELYASREVMPKTACAEPDQAFREFEASFDFEETPDQEKAIGDVVADLGSHRSMDRLVLGDVGYGKTEVALRASFLVAMAGKQVAMLCPTTILAQQHFDNFQRRLSDWPVEVRMLSRFESRSEQKKIIANLKTGLCDVVVGTHRLLSKDVAFRELGLLIVDEEQRFGVVQKEKIKQLKKTVDCLTLSATPIPRTMQMTMLGLRDMSVINTPPPDRQAIHTELANFDEQLIREAILREIRRQGQVFFVHNRVQGIDQVARFLARLAPEARIAVAHGQMEEKKLERVMHDFYAKKYDLLVSTAIIESGLDLPSANTMIINRADQFGLAQLYQLRGRIGRSREKAYAYLLVPSRTEIKGEAVKRLKALKEFTELGSGFRLAAYDLKIRGAGNLLGREQSGQISRIGYELYLRLLENKIRELKGQKVEEQFEPEIKMAIPAFLPEDYVPSDSERLSWYKRLAMAREEPALQALREELLDRYGKLPEPAQNLLRVVQLKFRLRRLRIPEIDADEKSAVISFGQESKVNFDRLIEMVKSSPDRFRFTKEQNLIYSFSGERQLFFEIEHLLQQIEQPQN